MVFAKVKRSVKVLGGAERVNYASCNLAAMGFVLDHLESNTLPKGLVSLLRDELDESTRTSIGPPVSPSLAPLGELYRLLGDWMSTECRGNWVRSCLRVACQRGQAPELAFPDLQWRKSSDKSIHCHLCLSSYIEKKSLNKHIRLKHPTKVPGRRKG